MPTDPILMGSFAHALNEYRDAYCALAAARKVATALKTQVDSAKIEAMASAWRPIEAMIQPAAEFIAYYASLPKPPAIKGLEAFGHPEVDDAVRPILDLKELGPGAKLDVDRLNAVCTAALRSIQYASSRSLPDLQPFFGPDDTPEAAEREQKKAAAERQKRAAADRQTAAVIYAEAEVDAAIDGATIAPPIFDPARRPTGALHPISFCATTIAGCWLWLSNPRFADRSEALRRHSDLASAYRRLALYRTRVQYPSGEPQVDPRGVRGTGVTVSAAVADAMKPPTDLADRVHAFSLNHNPAFRDAYDALVAQLVKLKRDHDPEDSISDYRAGSAKYQAAVESAIAGAFVPDVSATDLLDEAEQLEARARHRIPKSDVADLAKLRESATWIVTAAAAIGVKLPDDLPSPLGIDDVQAIAAGTYISIRQHLAQQATPSTFIGESPSDRRTAMKSVATYSMGDLKQMIGVRDGKTVGSYLSDAGVPRPGKGKRNHQFTLDEVVRFLEQAKRSTSESIRSAATDALVGIRCRPNVRG